MLEAIGLALAGRAGARLAEVLGLPASRSSALVTEPMTAEAVACGPDVDRHVRAFQPFAEAGFDEVYVAQIGGAEVTSRSEDFFQAYADKILPQLRSVAR
jgi:hypothetical protein